MLSMGGTTYETTKVRRTADGRLLGAAGEWHHCSKMLDWLAQPIRDATPPSPPEANYIMLEILTDGTCVMHESGGSWPIENGFCAIGSGRNFALGALGLGHTAREAVEVASRFDTSSGNGLDVLPLAEAARDGAADQAGATSNVVDLAQAA